MYTVLIDEAGDVGLKDVKPDPSYGPTQYFCMAATIFNEDNRERIERSLEGLPFAKDVIHASKLNHFQKVLFSRTISELPIGIVGVISNKLTLLEYLPAAKQTPTHFYNKVMQYLLERLGDCVGKSGLRNEQVRILLEARAQQYSSLMSFVNSIQRNPLDERSLPIRNIDRFSISAIDKASDKCMPISDMAAHALFSSVRRDSRLYGISESRYLGEMKGVFMAGRAGSIVPLGIKPIHNISDLGLPVSDASFLQSLVNERKEYCRL